MNLNSKECLKKLNEIYTAGNLRVLVGAGVSIPSGFPDWDTLNKGLLREQLGERFGPNVGPANRALLDGFTEEVYQRLGRDGVAELVLTESKDDEAFHDRVERALYRGRRAENLPLSDLQRQIAALTLQPTAIARPSSAGSKKNKQSGVAKLFTTNFDPLLAMALAEVHAAKAGDPKASAIDQARAYRSFRTPHGAKESQMSRNQPVVRHVHGWIDPDGEAGGQIIYAESHYMALQRDQKAPANTLIKDLFGETGATIIMGMSLTDPNLRRLLFSRSKDALKNAGNTTYLFTRRAQPESAAIYEEFWNSLKVNLYLFEEYSELPHLLREIQWVGGRDDSTSPGWFEAARSQARPINEDWFDKSGPLMQMLQSRIRLLYVTAPNECVRVTLFSPHVEKAHSSEPFIHEVGSVNPDGTLEAKTPAEWRTLVETRRLEIRQDTVQGLAGSAFRLGIEREVGGHDSTGLDLNFNTALRNAFNRGGVRDWRSLLAIPVLGGPYNLPIAVACVHSNFGKPFWKGLTSSEYLDLLKMVTKGTGELLIR